MVKVGFKIKSHPLLDKNGNPVIFQQNKKKIIFCFPRANTSGCNLEAQEFQMLTSVFNQYNYDIYGLCSDSPKKIKLMAEKCNISYALLSDENQKFLKHIGVIGIKKMYGKEYEGIVRSTIVCDEKDIITHVFEKVSPGGHAQKVADTLGIK
tara:strand:- start:42 stop:497 length:456 start_codon:yes stop_codon:yes gene_type:complete